MPPLAAPVPIDELVRLDTFDCGVPSLDDWLRRRALANQISGASRTYVVVDDRRVIAYYSLAAASLALTAAPSRLRRNMPDPIPLMLLGRLAVDRAHQHRGLGRALVKDAVSRSLKAAEIGGIVGLLVHAVSAEAKAFYLAAGFEETVVDPMTLAISMKAAAAIFGR